MYHTIKKNIWESCQRFSNILKKWLQTKWLRTIKVPNKMAQNKMAQNKMTLKKLVSRNIVQDKMAPNKTFWNWSNKTCQKICIFYNYVSTWHYLKNLDHIFLRGGSWGLHEKKPVIENWWSDPTLPGSSSSYICSETSSLADASILKLRNLNL